MTFCDFAEFGLGEGDVDVDHASSGTVEGEVDVGISEHNGFAFLEDLFINYFDAQRPSIPYLIVVLFIRVLHRHRHIRSQLADLLFVSYVELSRHESPLRTDFAVSGGSITRHTYPSEHGWLQVNVVHGDDRGQFLDLAFQLHLLLIQ